MRAPVLPAGRRSRGLALTVLCAATLMIILDGTIVTVALPAIQHDLGFAPAGLSWVMNAYLIPFGGLLLLAGRLGDLAGRKRVYLAGLALFTAASLACGLSASPALLVGSRFVQGAGAALVSSVSLGMIATLYPEPPGRARAIAAYSFVNDEAGLDQPLAVAHYGIVNPDGTVTSKFGVGDVLKHPVGLVPSTCGRFVHFLTRVSDAA